MVLKVAGAVILWAVLTALWILALGLFSAPGVQAAIDRGAWPAIMIVALGAFSFWLFFRRRAVP